MSTVLALLIILGVIVLDALCVRVLVFFGFTQIAAAMVVVGSGIGLAIEGLGRAIKEKEWALPVTRETDVGDRGY